MYLLACKYHVSNLLLSSPHMNESTNDLWRYAVITTGTHEFKTANMGFVLNQPVANIDHKQISKIYNLDLTLPRVQVYCGGPVQTDRCTVLHSNDYKTPKSNPFNHHCSITFDNQIVQSIVQGRGPKHWKIMLGHCEWADGQLDAELMRPGGWSEVPWHQTAWGGYKRKDKMWRRILEQHSQQDANLFLHTVFNSND